MTDQTQEIAETIMGLPRERQLAVSLQLDQMRLMDLDAIAVYTVAINTLEDEDAQARLREFRADHERHVQEIEDLVGGLDGEVIDQDCPSALACYVMDKMCEKPGDAGHLLLKFKLNEELIWREYDECAKRPLPDAVLDVVERAAEDERRHLEWAAARCEEACPPAAGA